jgi:hypothetical protein
MRSEQEQYVLANYTVRSDMHLQHFPIPTHLKTCHTDHLRIADDTIMAALDHTLAARSASSLHQLSKRKNWAAKEPGVILVFCIVGTIAILLTSIFVHRKLAARRAAKA